MNNLAQLTKKLIEVLCVVIMSVMSLMVFINVVLRYLANSSLTSSEELSRYLFVWLTFLAAILAYYENQHIAVDFIIKKAGAAVQKFFAIVVDLLILLCAYLITSGSWDLTVIGGAEISPVTMIQMSLVYVSGVLGGIGIGVVSLLNLYNDVRSK